MGLKVTLSYFKGFADSFSLTEELVVEAFAEADRSLIADLSCFLHAYHMLSPSLVEYVSGKLRVTACHKNKLRLRTRFNDIF